MISLTFLWKNGTNIANGKFQASVESESTRRFEVYSEVKDVELCRIWKRKQI